MIYIIRHGETEYNKEERYIGRKLKEIMVIYKAN